MRLKLKRRALMERRDRRKRNLPRVARKPGFHLSRDFLESNRAVFTAGRAGQTFTRGETQAPVGRGPHAAEGSENRRQTQLGLRVRF